MSIINERTIRVCEILEGLYTQALNPQVIIDETSYQESLDTLFSITAWGFREILLVVVVGMNLDKTFKSSSALYDCNPRAIYEGPIKEFLIEKNIPHRKSGPLNVAKATVGLDMVWAKQRRPSFAAEKVVALVNYMEETNISQHERITNVGISLLRRLITHSQRIKELSVDIEPTSNPDILFLFCSELIIKTPDVGNTPQKISAFLLKNYHHSLKTGIIVTGEEDRASVTSTTSKKPGDVNEESSEGLIYKVYEVTVKPFDLARIRDSYDCITTYNQVNQTDISEIIVICRKADCPSDMNASGMVGYLGNYSYQNIMYYYWEIFEWISNTLQSMTNTGRVSFYSDLNAYVNDFNTSEAVKQLWNDLHKKLE